eukprot:snap_masked-scaffold_28-processed-gene-0.28-mRNA-1 protein AED:1.00 eAED:1.00 QI:0/-1/0/0/-1/1/1/0/165
MAMQEEDALLTHMETKVAMRDEVAKQRRTEEVMDLTQSIRPIGVHLVATPIRTPVRGNKSASKRSPAEKSVSEIDLVSLSQVGSSKATPKKPRKKRLTKRDCEFYTKTPRYLTPSRYVVCEDDLRQAQKKMKGERVAEMLEKKNIHGVIYFCAFTDDSAVRGGSR